MNQSPPVDSTGAKVVTVDVREDFRNGREPFSKIMKAAAALTQGERLRLIAPFEPLPLFSVLGQLGFRHDAHPLPSGDWEVLFTLESGAQPHSAARRAPEPSATGPAPKSVQVIEVDARGLEPPQPMVRILEALASLPAEAELRARTDRRPMHLYPHLEERGFHAVTEEQADGFVTQIRRS